MKFVVLMLLGFQAPSAFAFTLAASSVENSRWTHNPLQFYMDSTCDSYPAVQTAADSAVKLWNSVSTSGLRLELTTGSGHSKIECVAMAGSTAGLGSPIGNLQINTNFVGTVSDDVLAVIVAHEMGHVLGLGHTSDVNALMYYDASDKTALSLGQDDVWGISYLYPRDELGGSSPFGCGSVDAGGGTGFSGSGGLGGLPSFVFMLGMLSLIWWTTKKRIRIQSLSSLGKI